MATPIPCDYTDCPAPADMLVSDLTNGDGFGWCGPHYMAVIRAMVEAADDAASTAEAQAATDEAVARLERLAAAPDPTGSEPSSDAGEAPAESPGTPDDGGGDQDSSDGPAADSGDPGASEAAVTAPPRRARASASA